MKSITMAEATHTQAARLAARMQREIKILHSDPPPRVYAWPTQDHILTHLQAQIQGPDGTPYADGIFKLEIQIPDRYPFEPPNVRFVTPVYHPNIDNGGRICLDILNLPPKGEWKPSLNIGAVLSSIRLLLSEPNPDDGLMADISAEYKHNRADFDRKARLSTQKYAIQSNDNPETLPIDVLYPKTPLMKKQKTNNNSDPVLPQLDSNAKDKVVSVSCKANMAQPVSKKLSLARGSDLQQEKSSCKQVVKDSQNLAHSKNINLHSAQNIDMGIQQGAVDTLFLEKSSHSNNPFPNDTSKQSSCLENASLAMPIDKENLHPSRNFKRLAKLSKSTISTGCQETNQDVQTGPTSTEADFRKPRGDSKMHISGIQRSTIPLKDNVQAPQESVTPTKTFTNVKVNEELEPQTIVVSDSESDEEPRPTRSRLSLGQLGLSAKRKRVS